MAFISKETINTVHSTADIISLVGEYTRLEKRTGNDWWGCCPFHNEKTPSFHVDGDKKFYYCFSCHASGDAIKFIMEMEKVPYTTAVESLAKRNNIPIKYDDSGYHHDNTEQENISKKIEQYIELYERTASMFHYFLTEHESGKNALDYIIKRGVDIDTIKKFKIGYSPADRFWLKKFLKSKNFSEDFLNDSGLFSKKHKDCSFFSDRLMFPIFN
jgi:DNA primase